MTSNPQISGSKPQSDGPKVHELLLGYFIGDTNRGKVFILSHSHLLPSVNGIQWIDHLSIGPEPDQSNRVGGRIKVRPEPPRI